VIADCFLAAGGSTGVVGSIAHLFLLAWFVFRIWLAGGVLASPISGTLCSCGGVLSAVSVALVVSICSTIRVAAAVVIIVAVVVVVDVDVVVVVVVASDIAIVVVIAAVIAFDDVDAAAVAAAAASIAVVDVVVVVVVVGSLCGVPGACFLK